MVVIFNFGLLYVKYLEIAVTWTSRFGD